MSVKLRALSIDGSQQFWATVHAAIATDTIAAFSDNGVIFTALNDHARMVPRFVGNTPKPLPSHSHSHNNQSITIHGDFYGLSADALTSNDTSPRSGTRVFNRRPAGQHLSDNFSIANFWHNSSTTRGTRFQFYHEKPTQRANSTISNCKPIIIDSIPFGPLINGTSTHQAGLLLSPLQANNALMDQVRHNGAIQTPPYSGNTLIAHNGKQNVLFIMSLPHPSPGKTLWDIRDKLKRAQCENAVLLTASNAAHMQVNGEFILASKDRPQQQQICISFVATKTFKAVA
ncbi:hypothetical protein NBRC116494_20610 [Aurantivibrio plasticivorans]